MDLYYLRSALTFLLIQSAVFAMDKEEPYFVKEGVRLGIKLPQNPFEEKSKGPEADSEEVKRLGVTDCLICHEENFIKVDNTELPRNVELACKHNNYCAKCIFEWKAKKNECPVCNAAIVITCIMCKGAFENEEEMTQLSCGHIFCAKCANRQILSNPQHPTCSVCKQRITLTHSPVVSPRGNNDVQNNVAEQGPIKQPPHSEGPISKTKSKEMLSPAPVPPQPQQGGFFSAVWGIFSLKPPTSPHLARRILNKPSNWNYATHKKDAK